MQIFPDTNSTTPKCDPVRLRLYLMDFEVTNAPLFQQYLSDKELETCIQWAVDDFNETTPIFEYKLTVKDFPLPKLLLKGAALEAMNLTLLFRILLCSYSCDSVDLILINCCDL